jgi:uncharacterized membrane protein
MLKGNKLFIFLFLIFLVNFLFKLIYIGRPAFWYDEIISVKDTLLDWGHIKHEAEWDKNPPFYHYVLWIWSKFFGISELGLRSMSAFFSSLTAVLIFLFSRKLAGQLFALCITLIFTVHPYFYYYSQEARCYSLLIFLITSNIMVLHSLVFKPSLLKCFLLGLINFLIFYTHYIAGLILFFQFIFIVLLFRRKFLYIVVIYLTPVLLVLIRFTKKQYSVLFLSGEMSRQKANVPIANPELFKLAIPPLYISFFILFILLCGAAFFFYRNWKNADRTTLYFKLFIILTPILCILSLYALGTKTNVFHERYLIFTIPLTLLSFLVFAETKNVLIVISSIVIITECANLRFGEPKGMDYRPYVQLVREIKKTKNINVFIQTHDVVGQYIYYFDRNFFASKKRENRDELAKIGVFYLKDQNELWALDFKSGKDFLFLQTFQRQEDHLQILKEFFKHGYRCFYMEARPGVKATYWRKMKH